MLVTALRSFIVFTTRKRMPTGRHSTNVTPHITINLVNLLSVSAVLKFG